MEICLFSPRTFTEGSSGHLLWNGWRDTIIVYRGWFCDDGLMIVSDTIFG